MQLVFLSTNAIGGGITDITGVKVRGDDGIGSYYWGNGIYVDGVSSVNFIGCVVTSAANYSAAGNGILLQGNKEGSTVYNITSCVLDFLDTALYYGGYIQGVTVTNTNMTNCTQGITSGASETGLDELTVVGCQIQVVNSSIAANSQIGNVQLSSNLFSFETPSSTGYMVQGSFANFAAVGNTFAGSSTSVTQGGINIVSGSSGVITGNVFIVLDYGVALQNGSSFFNIQSNIYNDVNNHVANDGTSNTVGGGSP